MVRHIKCKKEFLAEARKKLGEFYINLCSGVCYDNGVECPYAKQAVTATDYCSISENNNDRNDKIKEMIRIEKNLEQW